MNAESASPAATDADRYPTLTGSGRQTLDRLREHPRAPVYRNQSGNRLTVADVEAARVFERETLAADLDPSAAPPWLPAFVARCLEQVPFYRRYGPAPLRLSDLPTISRADLSRDVAQFVPDDLPLARLMHFQTSGTTGHPLLLPSHPTVAANYLAFHKRALRRFGVELRASRGEIGVILLGWQRRCFTYVSVTPAMDEAGLAKINLHPDDWRDPADRAAYLNDLAPEVFAGDPISFAALLELPDLTCRPRALLSTAMALLPGLRRRLEERFGCPVADLYSMNEAGPVGVFDPAVGGHVLLQPRLLVEILDAAGHVLPPGARGEIALTGGFNHCLPLLRYRTGDQAALRIDPGCEPVLEGLEGRPPVRYQTAAGEWINNLEITHALQPLALPQYTLRQDATGDLRFTFCGPAGNADAIRLALRRLFGPARGLTVEHAALFEGKVVQYTSDLAGSEP